MGYDWWVDRHIEAALTRLVIMVLLLYTNSKFNYENSVCSIFIQRSDVCCVQLCTIIRTTWWLFVRLERRRSISDRLILCCVVYGREFDTLRKLLCYCI